MEILSIEKFRENYPKQGKQFKGNYVKYVAFEVDGKIIGYPQLAGLADLFEFNKQYDLEQRGPRPKI